MYAQGLNVDIREATQREGLRDFGSPRPEMG